MNTNRHLQSWIALVLAAAVTAPAPLAAQVIRGPIVPVAVPSMGAVPAGLSLQPLAAPGAALSAPAGLSLQPIGAPSSIETPEALQTAPASPSDAAGAVQAAVDASGAPAFEAPSALKAEDPSKGVGSAELGKYFDGGKARSSSNFVPGEPRTQVGSVVLDMPPSLPVARPVSRVSGWLNTILGRKAERVEASNFNLFKAKSSIPSVEADPADASAVEASLRSYIDGNPGEFKGITSKDLSTVYVRRVEGKGGLTDTVYAHFIQTKDSLPVEGSNLTVTLKKVDGRLAIMSSRMRLFPALEVQTQTSYSDEQLKELAQGRIGRTPQSGQGLQPLGRAIKFVGEKWRSVQVYSENDLQLMVAVDLATGETFAWDSRVHMKASEAPEAPAAAAGGVVTGRGNASGAWTKDKPLEPMILPHLKVEIEGGQTVFTDEKGQFTVPGSGTKPVKIKARLTGRWAHVEDQAGKNLIVEGVAKPGETLQVVFNPKGQEEFATAQVNAYKHVTLVHDYLKERGITDKNIDVSILIKSNVNDECNAYYTPGSPSLNFFRGSRNCANTSFDSVAYHEYGHFVHDMIGGITDGGLSEGWGDILSMYITGKPEIGEGFLLGQTPSYIRHGDNDYQFSPYGEVHEQGQAWMGFGWKLRKNLLAALSDAGAQVAEHLVLPVFYAKAGSIPEAVHEVLLRDVDANGNIPHLAQIKAAADAHGLKIGDAPKKIRSLAMDWAKSIVSYFS